jgi:multicomponent Na+:H+ antiporter subunit D
MLFGYIFTIITFIGVLFALHVQDDLQHVSSLLYAGSALGVTFAGDLLSVYLFWEMLAVSSTFLILARRTPAARGAALRYILVHISGGLCLLAGIVLYAEETGSLEFGTIGLGGTGSLMIFLGIALNAAVPPLHPWLQDAYPEATVTGAVFMSALTTKSAVYMMARTFPGTELLVWLGAIMTAFPIFYAVLENDIRRVLAYSLINQVGFMMCGIGIGTSLAINGTVSHAFCHILYKALLFMAAGSVLHMTGKIRCTELGGLYKTMPLTCLFCIIGAASISAFPLFSGFVSKSMIISAAAEEKLTAVWLILQFASAGVFHHAGIKVPYFTFFGHDSGIRTREPPLNMLLAMGTAAFFCVFIALFPGVLYAVLPYPVSYVPYTPAHVVGQLQLLMFGALAFCLLILSGHYPPELRAINLDVDWVYRRGGRLFALFVDKTQDRVNVLCGDLFFKRITGALGSFTRDGPARLIVLFLRIFRPLAKADADEWKARESLMYEDVARGTLPAGIGAAAAAFFLVVVFAMH